MDVLEVNIEVEDVALDSNREVDIVGECVVEVLLEALEHQVELEGID